jgi:hypothetical protein
MSAARQSIPMNQRELQWNIGEDESKDDFDRGDEYL